MEMVSVITPVFNGEKFIKRVIESVMRQNYCVEHIIVDDCSTDASWEIINYYSGIYKNIVPVRLSNNSGPVVARNTGIKLSKGRFLAFLDVDDFWLPNKLELQIDFMLKMNCHLCYTDYRFVSIDGRSVGRLLKGYNKIGWNLHHMTRYLGCLTIVVDRNKCLNFLFPNLDPEYRAEDFFAWSEIIKKNGPALRCPHDLARYSLVPNSRSSDARRAAITVWKLYREVECIPFSLSLIYFIAYAFGVFWKRNRYRPFISRQAIDSDFEWSIL